MKNDSIQDRDLPTLLQKYLNNTCSKEELAELLEFAGEDSNELLAVLKLQWAKAKEIAPQNKEHWNGLFSSMMDKAKETVGGEYRGTVKEETGPKTSYQLKDKQRWIPRIAAAAAILLVLSMAVFFLFSRDHTEIPQKSSKTPVVNDIAPGGDKAVLTLADGTKIILDTAVNGTLAQQGGIKVIKIGGQLSYSTQSGSTEIFYNTITTPRGGQYQLELADGSKVWLNAASSLRFPTAFAGNERTVELTGEGYFEIAYNDAMPFHVKVKDMDLQVLGTHFNVNSYSDEPSVKTTLLEGRILVKKNETVVYLNPGQQAVLQPEQDDIRIKYDVDVEEVVAWKNGHFLYNNAGIGTIMRQVSRWYDVDVVFEKRTDETFSGGLPRSENVSGLLKMLEATGLVNFEINEKQIIVKPK